MYAGFAGAASAAGGGPASAGLEATGAAAGCAGQRGSKKGPAIPSPAPSAIPRIDGQGAQVDATLETRWRRVLESIGHDRARWQVPEEDVGNAGPGGEAPA